jgi:lysine biosynthesis protein LysW
MARVKCPDCEHSFELGNRFVGERFDCPECGVELEVSNIDPPEVDWAYDLEDQDDDNHWDDDEEDQDKEIED